jgi:hypothetical protein
MKEGENSSYVTRIDKIRNAQIILIRQLEEKTTWRPTHKMNSNITVKLKIV